MRNYPDVLLDPSRAAIAIIDHQPQMYFGVSGTSRGAIVNSAAMLMETAKAFSIPCVLTTVTAKSFSGDMIEELTNIFPGVTPIDRTSLNAWEDTNFRKAIEGTGKREIILAGLWTEICVTLPALSMRHDGYKVYVATDACGGSCKHAHKAALVRMEQAGVVPITSQQALLEFQRDWNNKDTYAKVMSIVKQHGGAYGLGVEYSETMVAPKQPAMAGKR
ncbi:MAG: hydrolase [Oscillospiraceae bacterium]|jgi:nicotinamidase-related amidase|nr:hydrolase [Oscillospiraceae bacterium]